MRSDNARANLRGNAPVVLDAEQKARVIDALRKGVSMEGAANIARIHRSTLYAIFEREPDFADDCYAAIGEFEAEITARFHELSKAGEKTATAQLALLERRFPKRWSLGKIRNDVDDRQAEPGVAPEAAGDLALAAIAEKAQPAIDELLARRREGESA